MSQFDRQVFLILLLIPFVVAGCDQQSPAEKKERGTHLEKISSSHKLAKDFFSELSSSTALHPELVAKGKIRRMSVALKKGGTVIAVVAPLRPRATSDIRPIRVGQTKSKSTYRISRARILYVPAVGEFYRVDQHFINFNSKTSYLRFTKFGSQASAVLKLKRGTVIRKIRTLRSARAKDDDWTTQDCLETAWDTCSQDAECAIMCTLTKWYCPAAVVVACAVSANNG